MSGTAEAAAGDSGNAPFGDEPGAEVLVGNAQMGDLREDIECALGFREG